MRLHVGIAAVLLVLAGQTYAQSKPPRPAAQPEPLPFASFDMASAPFLNDPHDLELGPDGMIYVADKFGGRVAVMDPESLEMVWEFGGGQLAGAHDVSFGPDGLAYVATTGLSRVDIFKIQDESATHLGALNGLPNTEGVLAHPNGRIYAMASGSGELVAFEDGVPVAAVGGLPGAHDVDVAPDGTIWVADNFARRIVNFDKDLNVLRQISGPEFGLVGARYLDVDDFGRLVVADQDAHRALLIDPDAGDGGALLGVIGDGIPGQGPGKLDDPEGALVIGARYYFADSDNNRIVRYSVVIN